MSVAGRRRVLMVEQGGRGGVADYTAALVAALAAEGWHVTLATAADHVYPPLDGVAVERVFHYTRGERGLARALRARGLGKTANGLRFLASLPRLALLARKADIVHTQGWEAPQLGPPALLFLRLAGAPVVQTEHGLFDRVARVPRLRRLARLASGRLVARMILHTEADVPFARSIVGERVVVIPHGEYGGLARTGRRADRDAARRELGIPAGAHVTLLFGQLRPDKGLADLVQAALLLPDLHLLVGGQDLGALGPLTETLADPRLTGRVSVREGFLTMTEAASLFAAADTVSLPYRAASQSGVLLLAYGFERPVVVYHTGGMREAVVDGQTGWICARADVDALVEALGAAIAAGSEECLRRGREGARMAEERFGWPGIARRTVLLYEDVLASS
jgi:glycosyltransferase involved in cell wall biosynthesis